MAFIEGLQSVTHIASSNNYLLEFREHRQALIAMKVGLSYIINNRYLIIVCLNLITQINSIGIYVINLGSQTIFHYCTTLCIQGVL